MYSVYFKINAWYDLRDYIVSSDYVPYISRNADCSLRIEEFTVSIKDSIKNIFGSNFEFEVGTEVYVTRENIVIFSGYVLQSNYNYSSRLFEVRLVSSLANLRNVKFDYNTMHYRLINTSSNWLYQEFGLSQNSFVNPIWVVKCIFEAAGLSLDINTLLEKTFANVHWNNDNSVTAAKYKQLFISEALLYYFDRNEYSVRLNAVMQPKECLKLEKGSDSNGEYYKLNLTNPNNPNWANVHHLNDGDVVIITGLPFVINGQIVTFENRLYKARLLTEGTDVIKATAFKVYCDTGQSCVSDSYLQTINNNWQLHPVVEVLKFTYNAPAALEIINEICSILGLQFFYTGHKSFTIDIAHTFETSGPFNVYVPQVYNVSDDEKYAYSVKKTTIEDDELKLAFKFSEYGTISATYTPNYGKLETMIREISYGKTTVSIKNNIEICIRNSINLPINFLRIPVKSITSLARDNIMLYTINNSSVTFTSYDFNYYQTLPSMFLHKLFPYYTMETIEIVCDAKTENKSVLENFIDIERDESHIKYISKVGLTL